MQRSCEWNIHTHEVYVTKTGRCGGPANRIGAVVLDKSVDAVEVRSVVPQIELVLLRWPENAEVLDIIVSNP